MRHCGGVGGRLESGGVILQAGCLNSAAASVWVVLCHVSSVGGLPLPPITCATWAQRPTWQNPSENCHPQLVDV